MKVKFFALLRDITGVKETTDFSGTTLVELLEEISNHYGKEMTKWLFTPTAPNQEKQIGKDVIILVNGRAIEHLAGLATPLKEDDEVAIFPRLAGG